MHSGENGGVQEVLRTVVAVVVLWLVARTVRPAWRERALALRVWRGVRARHLVGTAALLTVVLGVAVALLAVVPVTRLGLGDLVGFTGNALFAPVEVVDIGSGGGGLGRAPAAAQDPLRRALGLAGIGAFLGLLVLLFPWLAHAEERTFREGLEDASAGREVWTALRFGLVHLVVLVPLAAALAVGIAGYAYGRVYRSAFRRATARADPPSVAAARAEAVLAATTWHATFNTLVVGVVLVALATGA